MVQRPLRVVTLALLVASCEGAGGAPPATDSAASHPDSGHAAAATTAPGPDVARALAPLAPEYRGTIGGEGAVVARLHYGAGQLTGSYFYTGTGTALKLAGPPSGAHFELAETTDDAKTGVVALDLSPDGALNGTWADARGEKRLPVHLEPIPQVAHPTTALIFKRVVRASKPVREPKSGACKLTLTYPEAYGLPAGVDAKLDADLAPPPELTLPEKCDHAVEISADYRVAYNADGMLSVRLTSLVTDPEAATPTRGGRTVNVLLESGLPVKLFGDVVKPKAERTFESALGAQVGALARQHNLDAKGRSALDQAFAFSPPFVLEPAGVRLFGDSLPATFSAIGAEGVVVRYATLPRPSGAARVLWGK